MAKGFKELDAQSEARSLEHAEWLALLLEHEKTLRQQKRFESRARAAKLRHTACVEDVDYRAIRGLDRALFLKLAAGDWIRARHNLLVTGPCGVGKSWLACALGNKVCRDDFSVPSRAASLRGPGIGRADGRYTKMLRAIARLDLLILDDWGQSRSTPTSAVICLRLSRTDMKLARSSSPASCPSTAGTKLSATPTIADAILDRLVHNAYRIELKGESLRKQIRSRSIGHLTFSSLNDIIKSTHAIDAKGGRLPIGIPGRLQIGMHGGLRRYRHSPTQAATTRLAPGVVETVCHDGE